MRSMGTASEPRDGGAPLDCCCGAASGGALPLASSRGSLRELRFGLPLFVDPRMFWRGTLAPCPVRLAVDSCLPLM